MSETNPQTLAMWILDQVTPAIHEEALAGDLLEEFRRGRSTGWYWRQVLGAVAMGCSREMRRRGLTLVFAVFWSVLAPAWLLAIASVEQHFDLNRRFGEMEWPWSVVCDWGSLLAANVLFIWAGVALYLTSHIWTTGKLKLRPLVRGLAASMPAIIAVWAGLIVLPKIFIQDVVIHRISAGAYGLTVLNIVAIAVRVPFFLAVVCTLWGAAARLENRKSIAG